MVVQWEKGQDNKLRKLERVMRHEGGALFLRTVLDKYAKGKRNGGETTHIVKVTR